MNRQHVIETLRAHAPELRTRGVLHAALFGSLARNEATVESDIDIMIELDPNASVGVYEYVAITHYLSDLFPVRVDVANSRHLKRHVKPEAERDAVYAFQAVSRRVAGYARQRAAREKLDSRPYTFILLA